MGRSDRVSFEAELIRQTDKAGLFKVGDDEVWLPWSMIHEDSQCAKDGDVGIVYVPRWLAEDKEIEYEEE
jgi:hypothetical protein